MIDILKERGYNTSETYRRRIMLGLVVFDGFLVIANHIRNKKNRK